MGANRISRMKGKPVIVICTITDAFGVRYVEGFRTLQHALAFIPPAWARLTTPTRRRVDLWYADGFDAFAGDPVPRFRRESADI